MSEKKLTENTDEPIAATIDLLKVIAEEGLVPFDAEGVSSELRERCLQRIAELRQLKVQQMDVSIALTDTCLTSVVSKDSGVDFAFYVYRNDELIHQRWYSPDNAISFDFGGVAGTYRITGFARTAGKEIFSKSSKDVFVYGEKLSLPEINGEMLTDRPLFVRSGNHDFHCLFSRGSENRLFVLLTAAIRRNHHPIPSFNRWKWRKQFPGHVLCIADPTLAASDSLEIAWYLGSEKHDATADMADLVKQIAGGLGVENARIISYGSSAGGFAAMALASRLDGSMAVAINPQTDATKYKPRQVAAMLEHCFPGKNVDEARAQYATRLSMSEALASSHSRVLIVQNTQDDEHWAPHFLPFARSLGIPAETGSSACGRHASIVYSHENGHGSEPPDVFDAIIKQVAATT